MNFETATQFPEQGLIKFQVYIRGGKVVTIEKLGEGHRQ